MKALAPLTYVYVLHQQIFVYLPSAFCMDFIAVVRLICLSLQKCKRGHTNVYCMCIVVDIVQRIKFEAANSYKIWW